jgi:hypothetical protein
MAAAQSYVVGRGSSSDITQTCVTPSAGLWPGVVAAVPGALAVASTDRPVTLIAGIMPHRREPAARGQ